MSTVAGSAFLSLGKMMFNKVPKSSICWKNHNSASVVFTGTFSTSSEARTPYRLSKHTFHLVTELSDEEMRILFEDWIVMHRVVYIDEEQKEKRFKIFRKRVEDIIAHNRSGDSSFRRWPFRYSDWTEEDYALRRADRAPADHEPRMILD